MKSKTSVREEERNLAAPAVHRQEMSNAERQRLEAAYLSFGGPLWRAVLGYSGGQPEIADEAVAEAFAAAASHLEAITDLRAWTYRVAFRIARREIEQRRRRAGTDWPEQADEQGPVLSAEMLEILRALSPRQRGAAVLCDVYGFRAREAARILGTSEVAVRVALHGARGRLARALTEVDDHVEE
jgi:RNA polymerase sigma-70 factor (ECF subfamily)